MKSFYKIFKKYLATNPNQLRGLIPLIKNTRIPDFQLEGRHPCVIEPTGLSKFTIKEGANWNIKLLNWAPGSFSRIHNHPTGGCILIPINGKLIEEKYENGKITNVSQLSPNNFYYADGPDYWHKILNPCRYNYVNSLHIYLGSHVD